MIISELALVDTNILVYAADQTSAFHEPAKRLRDDGLQGNSALCISPQVLLEFFAVITDPRRVTHPRSSQEAIAEVEKYIQSVQIKKIYSGHDILAIVLALSKKYGVARQEIFDLHLVATMLANHVTRLYTYNREHFTGFEEIEVLTP